MRRGKQHHNPRALTSVDFEKYSLRDCRANGLYVTTIKKHQETKLRIVPIWLKEKQVIKGKHLRNERLCCCPDRYVGRLAVTVIADRVGFETPYTTLDKGNF